MTLQRDICKKKKYYKSAAKAKKEAIDISMKKGLKLYFYKCNICDGFHLTKKEI